MPQEDQAQDGHEIFVRREVRIGPQVVSDPPQVRLELSDIRKVVCSHLFPNSTALVSQVNHTLLYPYGPKLAFRIKRGYYVAKHSVIART